MRVAIGSLVQTDEQRCDALSSGLLKTTFVAPFWISRRGLIELGGRPAKRALKKSSLDRTKDWKLRCLARLEKRIWSSSSFIKQICWTGHFWQCGLWNSAYHQSQLQGSWLCLKELWLMCWIVMKRWVCWNHKQFCLSKVELKVMVLHPAINVYWRFSTAWYGTVRYGSLLGGFPLGTVPGTWYFFSTTSVEVPSSRTVTKTWRVNSADHWLAWENRHYCVTELATRDPPLPLYPLDLNQHSQRRIGRNFCLNKRTFLHQPQNSSVVVCWGSSDVPLVDSRGADPARAWWRDAEGKSLMYNVTFELAIFSEYVFCLYFYLCICVLLQLKTIWSNKCTSRLY